MIDIEHIGAPAFIVAPVGGGFVYEAGNTAVSRMVGVPLADFVGRAPEALFGPEVARLLSANYAECVARRTTVEFERAVVMPAGRLVTRTILTPLFCPEDGSVRRMLGVGCDITEQNRLREDLARSNARLATALDALGGAHWYFDAGQARFEFSAAFDRMVGLRTPQSMPVDAWLRHVHPEDREDTCFADILAGRREEGSAEFRVIGEDGTTRWLRCRRRVIREDGALAGVTGIVVDITQEKQREAVLSLEATTDPLTGLANRRVFEASLAAEQAGQEPLSLLMVDVDHFKRYNDSYGHIAGDEVLRRLAGCIRSVVEGAGGVAARYGGEEFVAVLPGQGTASAARTARALLAMVAQLAIRHEASPRGVLSVSIGIAGRDAGSTGGDLVALADAALYRAKSDGRACYRVFVAAERTTSALSSAA